MTGHQYLEGLLNAQKVPDETWNKMRQVRDDVEGHLRNAIGSAPRIYYAGSYGKNTMLASYHDLDLVVYYPSSTDSSLRKIYWQIYDILQKKYFVQQKDVAIRLPWDNAFMVDVVPGRATSTDFVFANLYRSEADSWFQTSIKVHIKTVKESGLRNTMRLMKLWNIRQNLGLRSFFVELLVCRALSGTAIEGYDKKVNAVFQLISDKISSIRIVDPANSNNVISDLISSDTKSRMMYLASAALKARYWEEVLW